MPLTARLADHQPPTPSELSYPSVAPGCRVLNKVDLRLPGLQVRGFAVQQLAPGQAIGEEAHCGCRAIVFLEGRRPVVAACGAHEEPGTVMILPPGCRQVRESTEAGSSLCAIIDFLIPDARRRSLVTCRLPRGELLQVREQLAYMLRLRAGDGTQSGWDGSVVILNLLITLLRAARWIETPTLSFGSQGNSAMHRLLFTMALETPLQNVVRQSGYQRDHLNRLVKKETGLTLGQFRTQKRLQRAKELLAQGIKVGDVAGDVGLPDQSYFARWFRRQTGLSPSQWLLRGTQEAPPDLVRHCG